MVLIEGNRFTGKMNIYPTNATNYDATNYDATNYGRSLNYGTTTNATNRTNVVSLVLFGNNIHGPLPDIVSQPRKDATFLYDAQVSVWPYPFHFMSDGKILESDKHAWTMGFNLFFFIGFLLVLWKKYFFQKDQREYNVEVEIVSVSSRRASGKPIERIEEKEENRGKGSEKEENKGNGSENMEKKSQNASSIVDVNEKREVKKKLEELSSVNKLVNDATRLVSIIAVVLFVVVVPLYWTGGNYYADRNIGQLNISYLYDATIQESVILLALSTWAVLGTYFTYRSVRDELDTWRKAKAKKKKEHKDVTSHEDVTAQKNPKQTMNPIIENHPKVNDLSIEAHDVSHDVSHDLSMENHPKENVIIENHDVSIQQKLSKMFKLAIQYVKTFLSFCFIMTLISIPSALSGSGLLFSMPPNSNIPFFGSSIVVSLFGRCSSFVLAMTQTFLIPWLVKLFPNLSNTGKIVLLVIPRMLTTYVIAIISYVLMSEECFGYFKLLWIPCVESQFNVSVPGNRAKKKMH